MVLYKLDWFTSRCREWGGGGARIDVRGGGRGAPGPCGPNPPPHPPAAPDRWPLRSQWRCGRPPRGHAPCPLAVGSKKKPGLQKRGREFCLSMLSKRFEKSYFMISFLIFFLLYDLSSDSKHWCSLRPHSLYFFSAL